MATKSGGPSGERGRRAGDRNAGSKAATALAQGGPSDADIVLRMRTGASAAFEQFVERFHPVLLDYARRAGVDQSEGDELVSDVLADVALQLLTPGAQAPRNPRMYLISAFRHRLLNAERGRTRRKNGLSRVLRDAALDSEYADVGEVAAGCSEQAVRESRGPGWEHAPLPKALGRLAAHLGDALTAEERRLLVAVAENIPQRQVAEWLGLSHGAARKKLERLRGRMMEAAMRYVNALAPDEAREVQRFFRRCRARIGARERPADTARAEGWGERSERDESDTTGNGR